MEWNDGLDKVLEKTKEVISTTKIGTLIMLSDWRKNSK
jgi:hypothetical protein